MSGTEKNERANRRFPAAFILKWIAIPFLATFTTFVACDKGSKPTSPEVSFVLANCTLIDGTGGNPIQDAVLVVGAGRILAVGPGSSTVISKHIPIINVSGATVLPGFINAHVHSGFNRTNLETWAQAGVTMVRDLAGPSAFALRDELSGDPGCARLVAAGPMVSVPGGYPAVPWGSPYMLPVVSPEDARQKVGQLLNAGADIVKLAIECGENFGLSIPSLSPLEASAAVQTAHERGTVVSAHVLVSSDLARALDAGVDDIAHMVVDSLPDALIAAMIRDSVFWIPTLELWKNVGYGFGDVAIGNLRKFVQAGGRVVLGTDYDGYDRPFQLGMPIREMEWMLEAGMSAMQVIVAGTRNAARVCNRQTDLGTLEVGKIADILVVTGDPLEDIHALADVRLVIRNGVIIRETKTPEPAGFSVAEGGTDRERGNGRGAAPGTGSAISGPKANRPPRR